MNRLVVVSNRVPTPGSGTQAGGLAVALAGLMAQRGGLWFGWSGAVSNDCQVQSHVDGSIQYATIDLTQSEHDRYYNEFSNSTLWPLLHSMPELMTFDRRNAQVYRAVNERMAASLEPMVRDNDIIWIHDYHLMAMPRDAAQPRGDGADRVLPAHSVSVSRHADERARGGCSHP